MTEPVPDPDCLHEINRKLDQIISFLSALKGPAPVLSGIKAPKFPLPAGAGWPDIVIKLTATYALISIRKVMPPPATWDTRWRAGKPRKVNFVELDCYDKLRTSRLSPDRHWYLFPRLAEHDGTLPWRKSGRIKHRWSPDGDNTDAESTELIGKSGIILTDKYSAKEISRTKKSIYGLRRRLKAFFGLADDPFYPYSQVHTYKTKFQLEPFRAERFNGSYPEPNEGLKTYNPDEWKHTIDDRPEEEGTEENKDNE